MLPIICFALLLWNTFGGREAHRPGSSVSFKKIVIDAEFRSEGVTVADINRDGRPDILAGNLWYEGPNWNPHEIAPRQKFDPATGYSNCFLNFAKDVNDDGWLDQVVFGFPGAKAFWRENPKGQPGFWKERPVYPSAANENPAYADLLGTGKPVLVFQHNDRSMAWYEPAEDLEKDFRAYLISDPQNGPQIPGHGLGVGDINRDGRMDVIIPRGYWLAPEDRRRGRWEFMPADLGPDCASMYVYDVNADGLMDVISSSAHGIGVWWFEQRRGANGPEFVQHVIDDTWSQSHALELADINGDGVKDIITGKRFWAHGPTGDVQPDAPCVLYWYELQRKEGRVHWVRHLIDADSGVGLHFMVTDVNGDGRLDIVTSNKKGVFYFEQRR